MNWISATGRRPVSAMPNAVPTIADSASGVSNTRCGAEARLQAVGRAEDAAELADVLTHDDDPLVGASACASARLIASTMTGSASAIGSLDVAGEASAAAAPRPSPSAASIRASDVGRRLALGVGVPQPAALEVRAQARQRIALAPLVDLVGRLVAARIVGGRVRADAIRQRLDQRRAHAAAGRARSPSG